MHYEKVGNNEPVCIEDQLPFEIPDSWEWVRFSSVIELQSGQDMTPDKYNSAEKGIPYLTGASNIEEGNIIINRWTEYGKAFAYKGDLLITCKGTVGTMAILDEEQVHIARQIMAIKPNHLIEIEYIQLVLETFVASLKAAAKSMIPGISREDILLSLLPLPPKEEQVRIIHFYKSVLPFVDEYSKKEIILHNLNETFPDLFKKSILQEAVQGKLVPQDENDKPASVLLERIRAEKQALIKAGKIKKDKHESIIFRRDNSHYELCNGVERCIDDEIPFEIPQNWCWCRLGMISTYSNSKLKINAQNADKNLWELDLEDIAKGGEVRNFKTVMDCNAKGDKTFFKKGDILYSKLRPYLLKILVAPNDGICTPEIVPFKMYGNISAEYIVMFLKSPYIDNYINSITYGVKMPRVGTDTMVNLLVPLPPLEEQHRIVSQIAEIMPFINNLTQ